MKIRTKKIFKISKKTESAVVNNQVINEDTIQGFKKDYFFLSNFYESVLYFDGKKYKSVEHAYQANKTLDENIREMISSAKTANQAKRLGNSIEVREDWDQIKIHLMKKLIEKKFENPFLRPLLLETGDKTLVNVNVWHDTFWGVYNNEGKNLLGSILMEVREKIKQEDKIRDEL